MTTRKKLSKGWRWKRLSELIEDSLSGFGTSKRDSDGPIQFRPNNVGADGDIDTEKLLRVPFSEKRLSTHCLEEGDVLFNNTNSRDLVGKSAIFEGYSEPVVFSNHITRLRVRKGRLDAYYLTFWLRDEWRKGTFKELCNRWVGQVGVNWEKLGQTRIPLPPNFEEQERIVEVLRQADAIRRKRAEARRLADQILPALFLDMFGDPITNPKNWPVDRFGNYIAEWQAGFASGKKDVQDGVRQLRMNNITTSGWINLDLVRTVARHKKHEHYLARKGDVIFNNTNSPELVGKTILFLEGDEFYFSNHLSRIRTTERVTNEWMAGLLHALWTKDVFKGLCRQWVNQASVSKESVFALEVPIPSPTALQNHQEALEYVSTRRDAFAISHDDAERLFSVLLSRAFTGELTTQSMTSFGDDAS